MAHCLRCEVGRAKVLATGMLFVGMPRVSVVIKLNSFLSPKYYLDNSGNIMRYNSPVDILISSA